MYINYNDFTYKAYRQIIKKIKENFKIIFHNDLFYNSDFYLNDKANRYIIIRHDVDFSVDRALELAKIESKNSVYSSYFFYYIVISIIFLKEGVIIKLKK